MNNKQFYKYSFFILLIIDLAYAAMLNIANNIPLNIESLKVALIWFVFFYWLPVWFAAMIIFKLRDKKIHNGFIEWLIATCVLTVGVFIVDQLLLQLYSWHKHMGAAIIFVSATWTSIIYFSCRFIEGRQKLVIEKEARKNAQLQTLRYQINPHFMFNSLNTISAYIHTKPDTADEVLHELADILRYSLETADNHTVSIAKELSVVKKYINIEKVRFCENLLVNINISEEFTHLKIPPFLIQPLLENAIKHNMNQAKLIIDIDITFENKKLIISIQDNGSGFSDDVLLHNNLGTGLSNIIQRVALIKNGTIALSNNNGANIVLEMELAT